MTKLLTTSNPKTQKGARFGYNTAILHLAPWRMSGVGNVCPHASDGCITGCLNLAGRGGIFRKGEQSNRIQDARIARTRMFYADRAAFLSQLAREIDAHAKRSYRLDLLPAVRLNGTSDIDFTRFADFWDHVTSVRERLCVPGVTFYDYTKDAHRALASRDRRGVNDVHLTYSRKETDSPEKVAGMLRAGINVAIPYRGTKPRLIQLGGRPWRVLDGDVHDLRFLDGYGAAIVALKAKGPARRDTTGFVLDWTA